MLTMLVLGVLTSCGKDEEDQSVLGVWGIETDAYLNASGVATVRHYDGTEPDYYAYQLLPDGTCAHYTYNSTTTLDGKKAGKNWGVKRRGTYTTGKGTITLRFDKQEITAPYTVKDGKMTLQLGKDDGKTHSLTFQWLGGDLVI